MVCLPQTTFFLIREDTNQGVYILVVFILNQCTKLSAIMCVYFDMVI